MYTEWLWHMILSAVLWKEVSYGVLSLISEFGASSDVFDIIILFDCHKKKNLLQKLLRDLIMRLQEITPSSVLRHVAQYKHGLVKGRERWKNSWHWLWMITNQKYNIKVFLHRQLLNLNVFRHRFCKMSH